MGFLLLLFFFIKNRTKYCGSRPDTAVVRFIPTIVPVDISRTLGSDRAQPHCLHPCVSAAALLLRRSVFALSDVGYALWNPDHHAFQRLGQTDLATQSRPAGTNSEEHKASYCQSVLIKMSAHLLKKKKTYSLASEILYIHKPGGSQVLLKCGLLGPKQRVCILKAVRAAECLAVKGTYLS